MNSGTLFAYTYIRYGLSLISYRYVKWNIVLFDDELWLSQRILFLSFQMKPMPTNSFIQSTNSFIRCKQLLQVLSPEQQEKAEWTLGANNMRYVFRCLNGCQKSIKWMYEKKPLVFNVWKKKEKTSRSHMYRFSFVYLPTSLLKATLWIFLF